MNRRARRFGLLDRDVLKRPNTTDGYAELLGALKSLDEKAAGSRTDVRRGQRIVKDALIATRGPTCMACATVMPDESLMHLHHVVPVAQGGTNALTNVTLLCPNCHAKAHWLYRRHSANPQDATELIHLLAS